MDLCRRYDAFLDCKWRVGNTTSVKKFVWQLPGLLHLLCHPWASEGMLVGKPTKYPSLNPVYFSITLVIVLHLAIVINCSTQWCIARILKIPRHSWVHQICANLLSFCVIHWGAGRIFSQKMFWNHCCLLRTTYLPLVFFVCAQYLMANTRTNAFADGWRQKHIRPTLQFFWAWLSHIIWTLMVFTGL